MSAAESIVVAVLPPPLAAASVPWLSLWVVLLSLCAVFSSVLQVTLDRGPRGLFLPLLAVCICAVAACFDAATWRIPNQLTYTAVVVALAVNALASGLMALDSLLVAHWAGSVGFLASLQGAGFCIALGLACLYAGGLGGGDLKLLVALGAALGYAQVLEVLMYSLLAALLFAVVNLVWRGRLTHMLHLLSWQVLTLVLLREAPAINPDRALHVPLAIPILAGVLLWHTHFLPLS